MHLLCERGMDVELSEASLKSSIAEAALEKGFNVAFDGTQRINPRSSQRVMTPVFH